MLRTVYALGCLAVLIWLLRGGLPLGAFAFVLVAVWLRRVVDSGRAAHFVRDFAGPS